MARLVIIVGNGLSIALNEQLHLEALTARFLEQHRDERTDLARLLRHLDLDSAGTDPERDFEVVVGGLEVAESAVAAFLDVVDQSRHPDLLAAGKRVREAGILELIRSLYYSYCAEVLSAIGDQARGQLPESIQHFCDWVRRLHRQHPHPRYAMGLFSLNYDVLLERLVVDADALGIAADVSDGFSGLDRDRVEVPLNPSTHTRYGASFFRPETAPSRRVVLRHLHGCLTHFQDEEGEVYKFRSDAVRDSRVYEYLQTGAEASLRPAVILGARKPERRKWWPFSDAWSELIRSLWFAETIVVAGYSFRDEHLNRILAWARTDRPARSWIVVDRKDDEAGIATFQERAQTALGGPLPILWHFGGFDGDLPLPATSGRAR